ncbi:MAG: hypothetical protein AB1634_12190 [Thermodesulfobacteriota bacterium]
MIWTIRVDLLSGAGIADDWAATIEIDSKSTLEDLHFAIQNAVCFDNDHLYEFFVARTDRSRDRVRYDEENADIFMSLESLFPLPQNKKMYYLFDYGDSWLFRISRVRCAPKEPKQGEKYPRMVGESGVKPQQYPEWDA